MNTGELIKTLRKQHDLTQEQLGELLGVKKAAVQKYEKGDVVNLKMSTIRKLYDTFGVPPNKFIFPEANEFDSEFDIEKLSIESKALESIEKAWGRDRVEIITLFNSLNENGQKRLLDVAYDLIEIEKYIN